MDMGICVLIWLQSDGMNPVETKKPPDDLSLISTGFQMPNTVSKLRNNSA